MTLRHFVFLTLALAATPALAGPRDDVMSAASRCAGITDDRSWLDCYYGAAQPMRAQLGLPPAPAAQTAKVPPVQVGAQPAARPSPAPAPSRTSGGNGFLGGLFGTDANIVRMSSYRFDAHGKFTVALGNGQVWEQLPDDVNTAHWREAPSKYRISVVERYGRAELTVDNDGQIYQVRRVN